MTTTPTYYTQKNKLGLPDDLSNENKGIKAQSLGGNDAFSSHRIHVFPSDLNSDKENAEFKDWIKFGIIASTNSKFVNQRRTTEGVNGKSNSVLLRKGTFRTTEEIVLFMPQAIQFSNPVQWENAALGVAGGDNIGKAAEFFDKAKGAFTGKNSFSDAGAAGSAAAGSFGDDIKAAGVDALLKGASNLTGANVFGAAVLSRRSIRNPHLEVLFTGVDFRKFSFSFKMAPRSEDEVFRMFNIVKAFRFHSSPEFNSSSEATSNSMIFPSEFTIDFIHEGEQHAFLPKIGRCVCTGVDVNYTDAGVWAAFKSGAPVQVSITVNFSETQIITKQKINEGF